MPRYKPVRSAKKIYSKIKHAVQPKKERSGDSSASSSRTPLAILDKEPSLRELLADKLSNPDFLKATDKDVVHVRSSKFNIKLLITNQCYDSTESLSFLLLV